MPGFLSEYEETETLKFGSDDEWFVKVRKHLQRGAYRAAQTALVKPVMSYVGTSAETKGDVDSATYQDILVFHAVVDWNFTDESGATLPLSPDDAKAASIALLPEEVFEKIVAVVRTGKPVTDEKNGTEGDGDAKDPFPGRRAKRADGERATAARAD